MSHLFVIGYLQSVVENDGKSARIQGGSSLPSFSSNFLPPPSLLDSCHSKGFTEQQRGGRPLSAPLVLFEAGEPAWKSLDAQSSAELIENLRTGGRLLYTFNDLAGLSAFWLSAVLPCTGWTSSMRPSSFDPQGATPVKVADPAFFGGASLDGFEVPLGKDIRPVSAVERGQARNERYRFHHPYIKADIAANSDLWSRPLLNREWAVRAYYDNLMHMPLLLTGRYGAGRVAMFATMATKVSESPQARTFWNAVMSWLTASEPASQAKISEKPSLAMSFPSPGAVKLTLRNSSSASLPVQLVMRVLDRDGAMLADGAGEVSRTLTLPSGAPTTLNLQMPSASSTGFEIRESEEMFQVRAGLLSADGSTVLSEQRLFSGTPQVRLQVSTNNLYAKPSEFPGPAEDNLDGFLGRMGLAVGAYAYKPGDVLDGTVSLRYQSTNLALLARVQDMTQADNASVMALNDQGAGMRRTPGDQVQGYGMWTGKRGVENVLQFTLPAPSRLSAVVLVGSHGNFAFAEQHNPGRAVIELDQKQVASVDDLDAIFSSGFGKARIALPKGCSGTMVTVRLPWVDRQGGGKGGGPRSEPWLGEIELEGWQDQQASSTTQTGTLTVELVDALGGQRRRVFEGPVTVQPGENLMQSFSTNLPAETGAGIYRLEAAFHHQKADEHSIIATAPLLTVLPRSTFRSIQEVNGRNIFGIGLLVTNGFTKFFSIGTGTSEPWGGWSHPDDLIWAYSRQFKEIPNKAHTAANRLYSTETDMRHYSTPWREYGNGELFFPTSIQGLVEYLKKQPGWASAHDVHLTFADRWSIGPNLDSCNSWQEYVAFDAYLHESSGKGLNGRTHTEVETSIHADYENEWQTWQLGRYVQAVRSIRDAFREEGKGLFIYSQGFPSVAGEPGRELSQTIRGMNDDFTWGMQDNNPMLTTGRNLGEIAFNPVWQLGTLLPWGFASPVFNNWQWHNPVATIEPIRRLLYDRTWRGMVWDGGRYGALATYAYADNVGTSFAPTEEEYQQWWNLQQRGNLLQPEAPLGAGLVISTWKDADPRSIRWNCGDPTALAEPRTLMDVFRVLSEGGLSVPFATNASTLASWNPTPGASLIVLNLHDFSDSELAGLAHLQGRGVKIAALAQRASLSSAAAALFTRPGTLLVENYAAGLTHPRAVELATQLINALEVPLIFSSGLTGYGFRCQDLICVVVEDWLEQARVGSIRLKKLTGARHAAAANLNDHSTLTVNDRGAFWEVALPIRSGDGVLLAIRES